VIDATWRTALLGVVSVGVVLGAPAIALAARPAPPSKLTQISLDGGVALQWGASFDGAAVKYNVWRWEAANGWSQIAEVPSTQLSYWDPTVKNGIHYRYAVRAQDAEASISDDPGPVDAHPSADTKPPTAPTQLTATSSTGRVDLSWGPATDDVAVEYVDVWRWDDANGWMLVSQVPTSQLYYSDVTAVNGTSYRYQVRAQDYADNVSEPSTTAYAYPGTCNLHAAPPPKGSDTQPGSAAAPFATVQKLDSALVAGQVGCLDAGPNHTPATYGSPSTHVELSNSGALRKPITITPAPGAAGSVVISGWVDIEGSYTTLAGLRVDGTNTFYPKTGGNCMFATNVSQGLVIAGAADVLEGDDIYQDAPSPGQADLRAIGVGIGWWGAPNDAIVRYNKIHAVGQCTQHDHLIYLAGGNDVQIYDNWLYGDQHGFGVLVYPGPTNARVYSNVIDAAGSGVGFDDGSGCWPTSRVIKGNMAWNNVVTDSTKITGDLGEIIGGVAIRSPGLSPRSTGNSATYNDSFANPDGATDISRCVANPELSGSHTTIGDDPLFVSATTHNYSLRAGSPVAAWGLWNGR
jgi:hypothetical protein